jgi:hypothetical protein
MEVIKCKCGKASMSYECIGIDTWSVNAVNTKVVKQGYGKICICKSCKSGYDNYDPCMVKIVNHSS